MVNVCQQNGPIANCLMHQFGCNGAIDTSADSTNHATLGPTNISNSSYLFADKFLL
jgi:hypothetical protein